MLADTVDAAIKAEKTTHKKMVAADIISNGRLGNLRTCKVGVSIDVLDPIADHLGVAPWQLLHPDARVKAFSEPAIETAALIDALPIPQRRAAYAMVVQLLEFQNIGQVASPAPRAEPQTSRQTTPEADPSSQRSTHTLGTGPARRDE